MIEAPTVILGILSDTHGRADLAAAAVRVLQEAGAEAFVRCGDVGGAGVLGQFAGLRAWFVWGNSDDPGPALDRYVESLGLPRPAGVPLRLELAGKRIAVFHGHEPLFARLARLAEAGDFADLSVLAAADYVLFGHSHRPYDERFGRVRFINPGAVYRARPRTVATLDLAVDTLRFRITDEFRGPTSAAVVRSRDA